VPPTNGISVRTSNRNFKGRGGSLDARLFLVSPEVAAATAVTGVLSEPSDVMKDLSPLAEVREPLSMPLNDNLLIAPIEDTSDVEIIRGPNIKPLPVNTPLPESLEAQVSIKAGDNISTDDITPSGAEFSSMRSNIPLISQYAFSRYDPEFAKRAQEMKRSFIVGGENYGQGSSREHAAIAPMYLGVKGVIAKSLARIHKNNLINHGVLPLIFENPADYDGISLGDDLKVENAPEQLRSRKLTVQNVTKGTQFTVTADLSDEEVEILICGGALAKVKKEFAEAEGK
jgi:aconitate hydratase